MTTKTKQRQSVEARVDDPPVFGLYECHAASADVNLTAVRIYHHHFVARDDQHAMEEARRRCDNAVNVDVRRIMDVVPVP